MGSPLADRFSSGESTNKKVLPTKWHWLAILFLLFIATVSTLRLPGGWVLYVFPALLYLFGRGRQVRHEGWKRT